jgi:cytochrome c-type biogenesis protein CcmH/NrfG
METVFWVIVAIVVLAVVYCVLTPMKRKEAVRRPLTASDTNEHGVDLQARRKTFDDLT